MGNISVVNLGKAYKYYTSRWMRLVETLVPYSPHRHEKKWVLKHINCTIKAGESVGIVGVNGAGKSTLLKLLTGTTKPSEGEIHIQGRVASLLELGMGFHADFSGRQNVYMSGLMMGLTRAEITGLMSEIERFADIGEYIDQPVRIYSSGMQIRLAFAVATAVRPDILIVDEALSVGDARFQAKCYARIAAFKQEGTTLLLVSHSVTDIVKHCERVIFLKHGRIALDGCAREVTNRYLDELFAKSEPNAKTQAHTQDEQHLATSSLSLTNTEDRYHTRPGYRPEEYRWGQGGAQIIDYDIRAAEVNYPASIQSNVAVDFYLKVVFAQDFDNVVPGILIKTLDGLFLYGTNSFLASEGRAHCAVQAGDVRIFKFSFPLNLNNGDYLLSFGISAGTNLNEMTPLDRRYDSVMLHVSKNIEFWGVIDLQSTFETCN